MHELSIALGIVDIAERECRKAGLSRVRTVSVNVGRASGVLPEALLSAFDMAKAETASESASLLINEVPLGGLCDACGTSFYTDDPFVCACPRCGSGDFMLERGRELDVTEIEAD